MPWARIALGRIKGGPERVTCETCHGVDRMDRGWQMPAVAALPEPHFRQLGWELSSTAMDAQMRNAIYGYLAESDNQARAAYMRQVVMPGMPYKVRDAKEFADLKPGDLINSTLVVVSNVRIRAAEARRICP